MPNGSNQRTNSPGLDGSIDALLGVMRPFAVSLRDVIMAHSSSTHSSIPSIDGSSTASPLIPSVQNRRAACTHRSMERLYGDYDCMVCHRPSTWGWIYSCCQDDNDGHDNWTSENGHPQNVTTADLTPWVQEAIGKGHYTDQQVDRLIAQRQKVVDTISASEAHFMKQQPPASRSPGRNSTSKSPSIDANGRISFPVITEVARKSEDATRQSFGQYNNPRPRIFPLCRYRACQLCRPTYRDRTWLMFEDAFTTRALPPSLYEIDSDRPVSDLDVVSTIGIRKAKARRPPLRASDRMSTYITNAEGQLVLRDGSTHQLANLNEHSVDIADQKTEADSKGFRDSVKRAFKGMLISRKRESWSSKYSRKSTRKMGAPGDDSAEFDLRLWKEMSEELLYEAAGIALPGHDGKDGLETEEDEVEVEDGVAVTEEAVDLGTADIIMSV